jgi:hypothetical protein
MALYKKREKNFAAPLSPTSLEALEVSRDDCHWSMKRSIFFMRDFEGVILHRVRVDMKKFFHKYFLCFEYYIFKKNM